MRLRWAFLWLAGGACLAAAVAPLPEIPTGTKEPEIDLPETYWYPGAVAASEAFLVGEVEEVSSDIETTPQQTHMSETCHVRVEKAFGHLDQLHGLKRARLNNEEERSPYLPVEPSWGRLRHLQKGQKVLVLIHEYEGEPCFGSEAVIELTGPTHALPGVLCRTAFQPSHFTDADLLVVKAASPVLHAELADFRARLRVSNEEDAGEGPLMPVLLSVAFGTAVLLILWFRGRSLRQ